MQSKDSAGGAIQGNDLGTRHRAFSIDEFCEAHRISRSTFYKLRQVGKGPRTMTVLSRTLISAEAAAEWRAKMEA